MPVADSHNAISRGEEGIHVNISLLCICSGIALRNQENHAHLTHCKDSDAQSLSAKKNIHSALAECRKYTMPNVYFHIQDVPLVGRQKEALCVWVCVYGCWSVWVSVYMCKEDLKVTRQ